MHFTAGIGLVFYHFSASLGCLGASAISIFMGAFAH
jgi:hypothetical protein